MSFMILKYIRSFNAVMFLELNSNSNHILLCIERPWKVEAKFIVVCMSFAFQFVLSKVDFTDFLNICGGFFQSQNVERLY